MSGMTNSEVGANGTQTVVILQPVHAPNGGGSWGVGERAGFEPELAADLIRRKVARALTAEEARATAETKARADREEHEARVEQGLPIPHRLRYLAGPPADRMQRGVATK